VCGLHPSIFPRGLRRTRRTCFVPLSRASNTKHSIIHRPSHSSLELALVRYRHLPPSSLSDSVVEHCAADVSAHTLERQTGLDWLSPVWVARDLEAMAEAEMRKSPANKLNIVCSSPPFRYTQHLCFPKPTKRQLKSDNMQEQDCIASIRTRSPNPKFCSGSCVPPYRSALFRKQDIGYPAGESLAMASGDLKHAKSFPHR
jgi:hypothetical protein